MENKCIKCGVNLIDPIGSEFICYDSDCRGIRISRETLAEWDSAAKLEPLEVPMPVYNNEELSYEEDLVKKIAVVLSVGNEAQAVRLIEKYAQYRLEPFEELVNNWRQQQLHYQDVAEDNITNEYINRKFTHKALAIRDCWKSLLTLINK